MVAVQILGMRGVREVTPEKLLPRVTRELRVSLVDVKEAPLPIDLDDADRGVLVRRAQSALARPECGFPLAQLGGDGGENAADLRHLPDRRAERRDRLALADRPCRVSKLPKRLCDAFAERHREDERQSERDDAKGRNEPEGGPQRLGRG